MSFVRRHPLVTFFGIAYGFSWAYWVPLALTGASVFPGSTTTHFPGLLGPAIAAFIVTALTEGRPGLFDLCHRLVKVTSPVWRFCLYALTPLLFLLLALAIGRAMDVTLPPAREYGLFSGLPPLGPRLVFLLVLLFNGFGEEAGWRGFAQPRLEGRFGSLKGPLVLAGMWAAWHLPTFFFIETYRTMSVPLIAGGFGLGICAGALVLSRVTERTGSVLAAALWHATYNMTSATVASRGLVAAVTTTCVMVWAVVILVGRLRPKFFAAVAN